MSSYQLNPFQLIFEKLDKIEIKMQIISANLPKESTQTAPILREDDILNVRDMAGLLGIPESTVRLKIKEKRNGIPAVLQGKGYIIERCAFQKWIKEVYLKKEATNNYIESNRKDSSAPSFMQKKRK